MIKKFSDQVVDALQFAVTRCGSAAELCRRSGVSNANMSRWLKGTPPKTGEVGPVFDLMGIGLDIPENEAVDYEYIPKVAAKAGAGSSLETSGETLGLYAFRRDYILQQGIHVKDSILLDIVGDSMEPLLRSGDTILVDQSEKEVQDGKTYLVAYGDDLRVKHCFKSPQGLILRSENTRYADILIRPDEIGSYAIIHGRVRWFSRMI